MALTIYSNLYIVISAGSHATDKIIIIIKSLSSLVFG
jgi:hypothetical protein